MRESQAAKDARESAARLTTSQAREAALVDSIKAAIDVLDDMRLTSYVREETAASILEVAIGRNPRRKLDT